MSCEEMWELLSARIDGEIDAHGEERLSAHLASCAACGAVAAAFEDQDRVLRAASRRQRLEAEEIAARVSSLVEVAHSAAGAASRRRRFASTLRVAAAAVVALAAGFLGGRLSERPETLRPESPLGEEWARSGEGPEERRDGPEPGERDWAARVVLASGRVEARDGPLADWAALEPGRGIAPGASLRTAAGARCELRSEDGSVVRLNEESEAVLEGPRRLALGSGQLWATVAPGETAFRVAAGEADLAALGTRFDVRRRADSVVLVVVDGMVKVDAGKETRVVRAGELAEVRPGGAIETRRRTHELVVATSWIHELLSRKGADDEELASRLEDLLASVGEAKLSILYEQEIRALGESCVRPLLSFLASPRSRGNPEGRERAAKILSDIAPRWAAGELIRLLADSQPRVRFLAARALERITENPGGDEDGVKVAREDWTVEDWMSNDWSRCEPVFLGWLAWWEENRGRYPGPSG